MTVPVFRLRAARKNHVWSYDFVHERTHDGRAFRLLTILDEYTRECLAIDVKTADESPERLGSANGVVLWIGEYRSTFDLTTGRSSRLRRSGTG